MYTKYKLETLSNNESEFHSHCVSLKYNLTPILGSSLKNTGDLPYNTFSISATSHLFYDLLKEIKEKVVEHAEKEFERMWIYSWINYRDSSIVSPFHKHTDGTYHGIIAVEPQDSILVTRDEEFPQEKNCLYLGEIGQSHTIKNTKEYDEDRVSIEFIILTQPDQKALHGVPML